MDITHVKTIKLTTEDLVQVLRKHFHTPNAEIYFQLGSDPNDDGPGCGRMILKGAVMTENQLYQVE